MITIKQYLTPLLTVRLVLYTRDSDSELTTFMCALELQNNENDIVHRIYFHKMYSNTETKTEFVTYLTNINEYIKLLIKNNIIEKAKTENYYKLTPVTLLTLI